jgi:exopolyphosphatase / guanosine-5'-triphosphate,3'-diphosphate pyrophosphatase
MRVGIVDVGGNTARLLVASLRDGSLERELQERVVLGLGAEIERRGSLSRAKLRETAAAVDHLLGLATEAGCTRLEVLVTSPGRQSQNRRRLERLLADVAATEVRIVSAEEEARLTFVGAVATTDAEGGVIAVCDVGGGSTEVAVGSSASGPVWARSIDLGSLRVTERHLGGPHDRTTRLERAREEVAREIDGLVPPPVLAPTSGLATGGTARALRKIVGDRLGADELREAVALASTTKHGRLARRFGLPRWRADSLVGGALLLAAVQQRLALPLVVATGGLREGAALAALDDRLELAA